MVSQGISPLIRGGVKSGKVCEMPIWSIGTASNSIKVLSWGVSVVFLLVRVADEVIVDVGVKDEEEGDDADEEEGVKKNAVDVVLLEERWASLLWSRSSSS